MPRQFTGLDAARIRANLDRIKSEIADAGPRPGRGGHPRRGQVRRRWRRSGRLAEAGLTLLGENRAQELEEKASRFPDFRWHFIGQLQSRKVKSILPYATLIHSVASESALRQLATHGTPETEILLEVNVAGEEGKAGIAPDELPRYLEQAAVNVVGLMTMPPFADGSGDVAPALRGVCASSRRPMDSSI